MTLPKAPNPDSTYVGGAPCNQEKRFVLKEVFAKQKVLFEETITS